METLRSLIAVLSGPGAVGNAQRALLAAREEERLVADLGRRLAALDQLAAVA